MSNKLQFRNNGLTKLLVAAIALALLVGIVIHSCGGCKATGVHVDEVNDPSLVKIDIDLGSSFDNTTGMDNLTDLVAGDPIRKIGVGLLVTAIGVFTLVRGFRSWRGKSGLNRSEKMFTKISNYLQGKKTYFIALLALIIGFAQSQGIAIPDYVWPMLAALGLGAMRSGIKKLKG